MAAKRSGKLNLPKLKKALLNALSHAASESEEVWHPHEELFVWVMFIGTFVAEQTGVKER